MAKFSERHKRKISKKEKKGSINYALGCLLVAIILPAIVIGIFVFNRNEAEAQRRSRIKTQYEEGLVGSFSRKWIAKGHEFTLEEKNFNYIITVTKEEIPDNLDIQFRVKDGKDFLGKMTKQPDGTYIATVNSETFEAGVLEFEAVATSPDVAGKKWTSEPVGTNITYPLYMSWTMDWEGNDLQQWMINQMDKITTDHKNVPMTHFFNPRVFSGGLSASQRDYQIKYVLDRRAKYGDDIGLHLHMWYDVPRAAGVTARTEPAWDSKDGSSAKGGWDVPASAYPYDEFKKILEWSIANFEANGLGKPLSFRAGGWYLDLENAQALEDTGFKIESSGRDARFWGRGFIASPWSLGSTTQPYKMSKDNVNSDVAPRFDMWQMPNNAADSYWFSAQDMITAVNDNYNGKPLRERRLSVVLSHPHWFNIDYPKLNQLYADTDQKYYYDDNGPIIYTTLEKYYQILESDPNPKYTE